MDCKRAGLGASWMEKIYRLFPSKVHLLDTQYRMHPSILQFPNQEFYGNRIRSGDVVLSQNPVISKPVGFIDTSNRSVEEQENYSTRNSQEAMIIRALFRQDDDIKTIIQQVPNVKVVVITPYIAQKNLLQSELKKVTDISKCDWSVSTVDSFQGQEADIVIISTVRTKRIGFTDDPQRLNVALTRAKRLVRIVGYKQLFDSLTSKSTLKRLMTFLHRQKAVVDVKVKNVVFSFPDWRQKSIWRPAFTQHFHNCMKSFSEKEKAVTMNILHAVVTPKLNLLHQRPSDKSYWHLSSLHGYPDYYIVWVAKIDRTIEAHFTGSRDKSLQFLQSNSLVLPRGSCWVSSDLTSMKKQFEGTSRVIPAWDLTNFLQRAIESNAIKELPQGNFHLDTEQEAIVHSSPPLLLESRSVTGKTNVLFQHALLLSQRLDEVSTKKPLAFITVSKLLKSQLEKMYSEVNDVLTLSHQPCIFLSLSDFLDGMAKYSSIDKEVSNAISFKDYVLERSSYSSLKIDTTLVENEIGGVIMGSLKSAEYRRPLKWEEYENDKRSNISIKNGNGSTVRRQVYEKYSDYVKWKKDRNLFDVNDMVLEIMKKLPSEEIFSAVYLDEIQDFSYAMIYLICKVGGKSNCNWIFAGDTAQMVSPGCSFKFAGLKQTLLSIKPGIETKLKRVEHLLLNYRTTKDVLQVGNSILGKAKKYFPDAIEYNGEEQAANDFRMHVVMSDWDSALKIPISFSQEQALVYSIAGNNQDTYESIKKWMGDHPFVLTAKDSKGLEFDDVVIAFDLNRNSWKVESQEPAALNMLRELYVAVTRAKRRVVILVKKQSDTMIKFLRSLDYQLNYHHNSEELFEEFRTCTSIEQWLQKANQLYKEERYLFASKCYVKSECPQFASLALGKYYSNQREKMKAVQEFIKASEFFYELNDYIMILDITSEILNVASWEDKSHPFIDYEYIKISESKYPDYLKKSTLLKVDIFYDKWDRLSVLDIESQKLLVNKRRGSLGLMNFLKTLSQSDVERLSKVIPCIVGDHYDGCEKYLEAIALYLVGSDFGKAETVSAKLITRLKKGRETTGLLELVEMWLPYEYHASGIYVPLLLRLFKDVEKTGRSHYSQCMDILGPEAIRLLVKHKGFDSTYLHLFCVQTFYSDILEELKLQLKNDLLEVFKWFHTEKHLEKAMDFLLDTLANWDNHQLLALLRDNLLIGKVSIKIPEEFLKRGLYIDAVKLYIQCENIDEAYKATDAAVSSFDKAEKYALKTIQMLNEIKKKPKVIPHRIKHLRELFHAPDKMNKESCEESIKAFGPVVIQEFVLRRTFYTTTKVINDENGAKQNVEKYLDITDVLKKFGSKAMMPRRTILNYFYQHSPKKMDATDFIKYHLKDWTPQDLIDIVDVFRHRTKVMCYELDRRKMYNKAAELYLDLNDIKKAIVASENSLRISSHSAIKIMNMWLTDKNLARYKFNQAYFMGIEKILKKHKMYVGLIKLYITWNLIEEAISASNAALDDKEYEVNTKFIVDVWVNAFVKYKDELSIDIIHQGCKLWYLIHLFRDPISFSKSDEHRSKCLSIFGFKVIESSINRKIVRNEVDDIIKSFVSK